MQFVSMLFYAFKIGGLFFGRMKVERAHVCGLTDSAVHHLLENVPGEIVNPHINDSHSVKPHKLSLLSEKIVAIEVDNMHASVL